MLEHGHQNHQDGLIVIGAGAAGVFGAIRCVEQYPAARVTILEKNARPLGKVRVSGGGRCNVTHACFDVRELTRNYPRGGRSLTGSFTRFGPADTIDWFERRGVALKTEADGRVFPVSDSSASIIDCLLRRVRELRIELLCGHSVQSIEVLDAHAGFRVRLAGQANRVGRRVLLTTGGDERSLKLAADCGHTIVSPVPSLFAMNWRRSEPMDLNGSPSSPNTSHTKEALSELAGISISDAAVRLEIQVPVGAGYKSVLFQRRGALLITHHGFSGPVILQLSSLAARELYAVQYRARLEIDWTPEVNREQKAQCLHAMRRNAGARMTDSAPEGFSGPRRLWRFLIANARASGQKWSQVSADSQRAILENWSAATFHLDGRATHKAEFVTAGGVALNEVDLRSMQSKRRPGLYLAGEVLDVDAFTGGFNFQNAWTGGWLAGESIAADLSQNADEIRFSRE
ncbi:MAG: aminoacetone oxidase family FAD-binding enzyme [Leptospiraceae bacterium]|nr:aminoacetone oxidase family FAD-binding enzyme [Leptospiraceae bacterium]